MKFIGLFRLILAAGVVVALAACSGEEPATEKAAATNKPPAQPMAPFASGGGGENAEAELKKLESLKEKHKAAEEAYIKDEKDTKLKESYITATLALADNTVNNPGLPSTEKYPEALRLYRRVIELDPENKEALEWRDTIVGIYEQMGKPVPK